VVVVRRVKEGWVGSGRELGAYSISTLCEARRERFFWRSRKAR
jgi:hypothetical protein